MHPHFTAENTEAPRAQVVSFIQATQLGSGGAGLELPMSELRLLTCLHAVGRRGAEPQGPELPSPSRPHSLHLRQDALFTHCEPSFSKSALSQAGPGSLHLGSACPVHGGAGGHMDPPPPKLDGTALPSVHRGNRSPEKEELSSGAHSDGLQLERGKLRMSVILPDTVLSPLSVVQIAVVFQIIPQTISIYQRMKLRLGSLSDLPKVMQLGLAEAGI